MLKRRPQAGISWTMQILNNLQDLYKVVLHFPSIDRSDHQYVLFIPKTREKIKPSIRQVRLMKPENIRSLGLKLNSENWDEVYSAQDVHDKVNLLTCSVHQTVIVLIKKLRTLVVSKAVLGMLLIIFGI